MLSYASLHFVRAVSLPKAGILIPKFRLQLLRSRPTRFGATESRQLGRSPSLWLSRSARVSTVIRTLRWQPTLYNIQDILVCRHPNGTLLSSWVSRLMILMSIRLSKAQVMYSRPSHHQSSAPPRMGCQQALGCGGACKSRTL